MDYVKTILNDVLTIKKIVTVHYFEYARDYVFEGEQHDFWEFLVVDKGEVEVMAGDQGFRLKQGDIIFHKPNEFHNVWANGKVAPNLIVISFECKSPSIRYFENKILSIGDFEKNLLAQIIREAKNAFTSPLHIPTLEKLEKNKNARLGSEQLIRLYLEQILIYMLRERNSVQNEAKLSTSVKERSEDDMIKKIKGFLEANVTSGITFDDVCRFMSVSRTHLKVLFKEHTDLGVMEYYNNLKIGEAKRMIREGERNFTQIADALKYNSIHYFSRHFKKVTDMTPSQYASSVKIKI